MSGTTRATVPVFVIAWAAVVIFVFAKPVTETARQSAMGACIVWKTIGGIVGRLNVTIDQGATFERTIVYKDSAGAVIDITGYTVRGQLRRDFDSEAKVDFTLSVSNAAVGEISWSLTDAQTSAMEAGKWVYDIEVVTTASKVIRLLYGRATVTSEVTR